MSKKKVVTQEAPVITGGTYTNINIKEPYPVLSPEPNYPVQINPADSLIQVAVSNRASIDELDRLLQLQERYEKRQAEKAFTEAMAAFKRNPPVILKNIQVNFEHKQGGGRTAYNYADIAQVSTKIAEGLALHGISHRWKTEQLDGGKIKVTCILTHFLGHSESESLTSVITGTAQMSELQKLAGTRTYLERHTLLGVTGIATSEADNDGQGDSEAGNTSAAPDSKDYPQERFEANFQKWSESIKSGKQTKENLITFIQTKGRITEAQRAAIDAI